MAAFRNGIKTVIIPMDNEKDLEEIDQTVRKALQFVLVERADQVLSAALNRPAEVVELPSQPREEKKEAISIPAPQKGQGCQRPRR